MKKNNKFIVGLLLVINILFTILSSEALIVNAAENNQFVYRYDNRNEKKYLKRRRSNMLRYSVIQLKDDGVLDENDVKNIEAYMYKDREEQEKKIKEKMYNMQCEKIDSMIKDNVITKQKGEKLKSCVKKNIENKNKY